MEKHLLTLILVILGLGHLWLQLFNRFMLSIPEGRLKEPIFAVTFLGIVLIPSVLLLVFGDTAPLDAALGWRPVSLTEILLFSAFAGIWIFMLWRMGLLIADILFPMSSHRVLSEERSNVALKKPKSQLPAFLSGWDTTFDLEFRDLEIQVRYLPREFDGLTLLQVSDLHFEEDPLWLPWFKQVRDFANSLEPDLVMFTGDFVNDEQTVRASVEYHGGFEARVAKLGVLGNHDYWTRPKKIRSLCKQNGIKLIHNEPFILMRHGRKLVFSGTDSPWNHKRVEAAALHRDDAADCLIFLSHTPDNGPLAAMNDAYLILSGHNHGGQIRLPIIGPLIIPSRYGRMFCDGLFDLNESSVMVVSRGIGCSRFGSKPAGKFRLGCKPELIRITLRAPFADLPVRTRGSNELFKPRVSTPVAEISG
jgi:predicted MPP superfamily phosphohydrolase